MTPHELIVKLTNLRGPCMRWCSYCPDELDAGEIKECVEKMYKEIYELQADKDYMMEKLVKLSSAYYKATGHLYNWEDEDENKNS